MKFKYDSNVRNSLENVWDFIMNFERRPEWIHFFDKSFISEKADTWVGTKYKEKLTFLGIPLFIEYEITEYQERSNLFAICKMPPFKPKIEIQVRDNGDGTIYSSLEFEIKLVALRFAPKKFVKKQVDKLILPVIDNYIRILDQPA